jgi:hypothetical protein
MIAGTALETDRAMAREARAAAQEIVNRVAPATSV